MNNNLIVIDGGKLRSYVLDDKTEWEVGRAAGDNSPDIKLYSPTVSRRHGKFHNMDGIWFYVDYNSKNGTLRNGRRVKPGLGGRLAPCLLRSGDTFVFGEGSTLKDGEEAYVDGTSAWAIFRTGFAASDWQAVQVRDNERIMLSDGYEIINLDNPGNGTVVEKKSGIAIYMNHVLYLSGSMKAVETVNP